MGQKNQLWWDIPASESFLLNKHIYQIQDSIFNSTIDELVDLLDVRDKLDVQVRRLSLGERMKMEIIAALLHKPSLILLDEPTLGLDVIGFLLQFCFNRHDILGPHGPYFPIRIQESLDYGRHVYWLYSLRIRMSGRGDNYGS